MLIIDRYITRTIILSMLFALVALSLIFIVVNLIESLDRFIDQHASAATIVQYYVYFLPEIIKLLLPITVLVAVLFVIGKLTDTNEVTAMKSAGMSLYRLMIPVVSISIIIAVGHLYFNGWIVPHALSKKFAIERQYLGRNTGGIQDQLYSMYLRDTPRRVVAIGYYDLTTKQGNDITIDDYSDDLLPRSQQHIEARRFFWDSTTHQWHAEECFIRTFSNSAVQTTYLPHAILPLSFEHNRFATLQRSLEEMTYSERRDFIGFLRAGGRNTRQLDIAQAGDVAFPFANLIVVLLATPFASVKKRSGLATNIAAAMTVTFLYLVLTKVFQAIGTDTELPPVLIGWSANMVFALVAAVILVRTPT